MPKIGFQKKAQLKFCKCLFLLTFSCYRIVTAFCRVFFFACVVPYDFLQLKKAKKIRRKELHKLIIDTVSECKELHKCCSEYKHKYKYI